MCLQIFQFQIQKTSKTGENVKWSHGLSKGSETKISPLWSQVTWGGELIGLVQYCPWPQAVMSIGSTGSLCEQV